MRADTPIADRPEVPPPAPPEHGLAAKTMIGAAWLLAWRAISRCLGLVSTLVLARILVPADFGVVAMATTFAAAVDALSELGLQDALVRRVGEDRRLFNTAFTLQAGRALVTAAVVAGAAPWVGWWFGEPRLVPVLFVLAAASLLSGVENVGIAEFRRAMRFDMQFRLLFVPRLLQVAVTIPAAIMLQSYWALLIGIVVSKLARTVMTYVVHPYRPCLGLTGWRELAGFSFWIWASCAASLVWDRLDPFVLGPVIGPAQLGVYLLALELATLPISEVIAPVADALFAGFASAQKRGQNSTHHAPLVATTLVMLLVPLVITISCASGYVVAALLGPKWIAADVLVAIMAWLCLFSPFSYVCNAVLVANGYVRRNFIGKVVASTVKLVTVLIVIRLTDQLEYFAAAVTVCVAAESLAYTLLLKGTGQVRLSVIAWPLGRTLLSGALVIVALQQSGLAWQAVSLPAWRAFAGGAMIGALVAGLYGTFLLLAWLLAGRPAGPETQIIGLGVRYARPFVRRLGWRI